MKFKSSVLSLLLAEVILFSPGCSQTGESPDAVLTESASHTAFYTIEETKDLAITVYTEDSEPVLSKPVEDDVHTSVNSETDSTDSSSVPLPTEDSQTDDPSTVKPSVSAAKPATVTTSNKPVATIKPSVTTSTANATTVTAPAPSTQVPEQKPSDFYGFKVNGTKLYDANGNEFIMRGINHAHTWFKGQLNTAIPAIAATGANTVRIVLSDGQQWTKDSVADVKRIIELCKKNKLICILEVHDITGKQDINGLRNTVKYWLEVKSALIGNEAYAILNIANEWVGDWNSDIWYNGYSEAIKSIRDAGIKNTVMIDAAGWGQYAECIGINGTKLLNDDPDKNIIFSIHMYGSAGGNSNIIKRNLQYASNKNLCVIVGEFGYYHSDGDVDEKYIMKYCTDNRIGYLGWSWKGNGVGVEYLDIALDWEGKTLSKDWGEVLINGSNGIKETSKICSVFI